MGVVYVYSQEDIHVLELFKKNTILHILFTENYDVGYTVLENLAGEYNFIENLLPVKFY